MKQTENTTEEIEQAVFDGLGYALPDSLAEKTTTVSTEELLELIKILLGEDLEGIEHLEVDKIAARADISLENTNLPGENHADLDLERVANELFPTENASISAENPKDHDDPQNLDLERVEKELFT